MFVAGLNVCGCVYECDDVLFYLLWYVDFQSPLWEKFSKPELLKLFCSATPFLKRFF